MARLRVWLNKENNMSGSECLAAIKSLASSQGLYSRLYAELMEASEQDRNGFLQNLEDEKFEDVVDMCIFLES